MLGMPKTATSAEVAHLLLSEYVFIHLDQRRPADKLALLMQMLHKLYALVSACWRCTWAVGYAEGCTPGIT